MDRKEIKEKAKELLKGNLWKVLWPYLVISVVYGMLDSLVSSRTVIDSFSPLQYHTEGGLGAFGTLLSFALSLAYAVVSAGYLKYLLDFVRGKELDPNKIIETVKEKWQAILTTYFILEVIVLVATLALVIPGIVASLALAMALFIVIDSDKKNKEALVASKEMMDGHKWELFVFYLSFIGWFLLIPLTLGLICIYLVPYMNVAVTLYYENLKKLKK